MSKMELPIGFDFYESLRYILPGYFLLFLTAPYIIPDIWLKIDITEKIVYGFILGFFLHSFGIYKIVPGVLKIRNEHKEKHQKLIGEKPNHILLDVMSFTYLDEKNLFKRYYGLGALKLDIVAILILTVFLQIYNIITKWIEIQQNILLLLFNFLFVVGLFLIGYVLRKDGMNDLKRAYNLELFVIMRDIKKKGSEMKKMLTIVKENKKTFFR